MYLKNIKLFVNLIMVILFPFLFFSCSESIKIDSTKTITISTTKEQINSGTTTISGTVNNLKDSDNFELAVYVKSGSSWYNKPSWASPKTIINDDGTWSCIVGTGIDEIRIFLVTSNITIPLSGGSNPEYLSENLSQYSYAQLSTKETISFSGYNWAIKDSGGSTAGPGSNYWSSSNVELINGKLKLKINYDGSKWNTSEIYSIADFGYGTYTINLGQSITSMDPNIVIGLFTYNEINDASQLNTNREIDIEISKWGQTANNNSQFQLQPYDYNVTSGNINPLLQKRFNSDTPSKTTHRFTWTSSKISFESYYTEDGPLRGHIESWEYTGALIPLKGFDTKFRFNFWLINSTPKGPINNLDTELIIDSFKYTPL